MATTVRLGYTLGDYPRTGDPAALFDSVAAEAVAAELAGFDSVWVPDHLMQAPVVAPRDDPMLECYVTLGALAALTTRARLGDFDLRVLGGKKPAYKYEAGDDAYTVHCLTPFGFYFELVTYPHGRYRAGEFSGPAWHPAHPAR
jgi:hypothetical protein